MPSRRNCTVPSDEKSTREPKRRRPTRSGVSGSKRIESPSGVLRTPTSRPRRQRSEGQGMAAGRGSAKSGSDSIFLNPDSNTCDPREFGYLASDPMSKIERIKAATDGLDIFPELMRAAREGWETLDPDHVGLLKWYGLYAHNTHDGHFMLRTKVIQGVLSADQAEVMASIARDFGRGIIDCTTRQCFQIHWITLDKVPEIFERLDRVGLTTAGACGDITRNVVGCTLAGLGHDEIVDGYATATAIHNHFLNNKLYSNLPRKYKISVTGCTEDCARGLINDIALSGAIAPDGTRGFNLRVGGGLSSHPRFARWMDVFVTPEEAPEVIEGMTGIFRDSEENRKARGKARLKFLVDRVGPEELRAELERRVGRPLKRGVPKAPGLSGEDHIGVLPQADDAYRTVGMVVPVGRLKIGRAHV